MNNRHIDEWALHAYLDNELSPEQRAGVEALLRADPPLAEQVEAWRRQRAALKRAFDGVLAEPVPPQLAATLRGAPVRRARPYLAAAAALLLLLLGGLAGWLLRGGVGGDEAVLAGTMGQRAIAAHEVFSVEVRHPVEVRATEKAHLQAWLSKRMGTPFTVPDLSAEGYQLLGGRLLAEADGPSGLLMYENGAGQRISILLAPYEDKGESSLHVEQQGPLIACTWRDGRLAFAVAGEMAREPMMKLAQAIYDQFES